VGACGVTGDTGVGDENTGVMKDGLDGGVVVIRMDFPPFPLDWMRNIVYRTSYEFSSLKMCVTAFFEDWEMKIRSDSGLN